MVRQRPPAELSCAARPLPALRGPDFSAVSRRGGRQRPAVAPLLPEPRVLRQDAPALPRALRAARGGDDRP